MKIAKCCEIFCRNFKDVGQFILLDHFVDSEKYCENKPERVMCSQDRSWSGRSEVGAAARGVHAGLVRALRDRIKFEPLRKDQEGDRVALEDGYSPAEVRILGTPIGAAPWKGELIHPGWVATEVALPRPGAGVDARILAPAEVEVGGG